MSNLLRKSAARKELGQSLERQISARARARVFFAQFGVPDTMDGRFDLVALHAWLVLARLKAHGLGEAAQALTDALFVSFDEALREQGVSDMGMGRRMRAMADAFYGRCAAYAGATNNAGMAEALARNVWRGASVDSMAGALARYVESARAALAACDLRDAVLDFGPLPETLS